MSQEINFIPQGQWLLLPDPTSEKRASGIILDEGTAKKLSTNILKVLKAGSHCQFCKIGDTVMVDPTTEARRVTLEEVTYLLIGEHQVLGRIA
jgi:co-chaperonin GroES (HSP10)|tara:strand:- start:3215 stop:3493 length:279 start_codon:yes stop_codon:yes gene_type:complete